MEHPFLSSSNLQDKKPEELQSSITSLMSKLNFAMRTGNEHLTNQIKMVLESYQTAYSSKMNDLMKKKDISEKINISK